MTSAPTTPSASASAGLNDNGASHQAEWLDGEFRRWLDRVYQRVDRVIGIWGNHDFVGEPNHFGVEPPNLDMAFLNDERR